jgi:predicted amidophosphoribosyltransferase
LARPKLRFGQFVRVGRYTGTLRRLILRFKHSFVLDRLLGRCLGAAILGRLDPDLVDDWVPVPAHWARRLTVGFQPTALLARAAAGAWRGQVVPALRTTRYIPPFHLHPSMASEQRAEAVSGAFEVVDPARIAGRRLCVIDDVTTTGATLAEAKRALHEAGAASVWAAVLAKTSSTGEPLQGLDRRETRP